MPLKDPVIDDRKYADILAEIRTRIPRYTPEWKPQWNDLNDSDPGMILAQTFAWLSEMLLFRMQRVPDLHYVKFLQLIGIELLPALPAGAEVTFAVADTPTTPPTVIVPPRTQVSAPGDDGAPIIFETERALTAVACAIVAVQAYDGAVWDDLTALNAQPAAPGFLPFGEMPRDDAALVIGLAFGAKYPAPDVLPPMPIDVAVFAAEAQGEPQAVQCDPSPSRLYPSAQVVWEGFDGTDWRALELLSDESVAFTRSGHVVVRIPAAVKLQRAYLGGFDAIDPATRQPRDRVFWIRARLAREQYERPPALLAIRTNTVPVLQARTVIGEVLGGTSGARNQTFQLQNTPVIQGTLTVQINEGRPGDEETWAVVDDLLGSQPTDQHLAVNWATGEVQTGDGEHGQVPVANPDNPDANVVATEYRYGGGRRGNVAAGAIATLVTPVPNIDGAKTTNLFEAAGGSDEERLEDARIRARQILRARDRAVSADDFEALARQAGNVRRAKAVPLANPMFPGAQVPGAITVIVVPDSKAPNPQPSDGLLRTVCAYLDVRRLLTTEVYVVGPRYVEASVAATVVVQDTADPARVKQDVESTLLGYLHPLTGGEDGAGWPFGGPIRYSRLVHRVFSVDGVDNVSGLTVTVGGEAQPECRDVAIDPLTLVYSTAHAIEAVTAREFEAQP